MELPSEEEADPLASQALRARQASEALQQPAVLPGPGVQQETPAYRESRPAVFRPKQKGKQKVQQEYPQTFLPRLDEAAAFPQNRWSCAQKTETLNRVKLSRLKFGALYTRKSLPGRTVGSNTRHYTRQPHKKIPGRNILPGKPRSCMPFTPTPERPFGTARYSR